MVVQSGLNVRDSGWPLVTPPKPCLAPSSARHSLLMLSNALQQCQATAGCPGVEDKDMLYIRPAESTSDSYKSKGNFIAAVVFVFFFFSSRKVQFLLLDKRFNQMRQVQYLANGVKVENPVYLLSNEMLKLIYDPYEAIMQIFHVV